VDRGKAEREAKVVVAALWSTIGSDEFVDMRSELPKDFGRPALEGGVARSGGKAMRLSLEAFLREVARREHLSRAEAFKHPIAVLAVLREAVGEKEFSDTVAQFPGEFRELLRQDARQPN
jgi:uncharacterized protein (DUF2267 family)